MPRVIVNNHRLVPKQSGLSPIRQFVQALECLTAGKQTNKQVIWRSFTGRYLLALPVEDYVTLGLTARDHRDNAGVALLAHAASGNDGAIRKVGRRLAGLDSVHVVLANSESFMLAAATDAREMLHEAYYARATMAGVRTANLAELPEGVQRKDYAGSRDYECYRIFTALREHFATHDLPEPVRPEDWKAHVKAAQRAASLTRLHSATGELAL